MLFLDWINLIVGLLAIAVACFSIFFSWDSQRRSEKSLEKSREIQDKTKGLVNGIRNDVGTIKSDMLERENRVQELLMKMTEKTAQPSMNEIGQMMELLEKLDPDILDKISKLQDFPNKAD